MSMMEYLEKKEFLVDSGKGPSPGTHLRSGYKQVAVFERPKYLSTKAK